jgi:hypothetical protein
MPKYGGVHYPNDYTGPNKLSKGKSYVSNDVKRKFGKTSHVPNGKDTFGDYTKRSIDDGGTGSNATRSVLNKYEASMWKYPKPT